MLFTDSDLFSNIFFAFKLLFFVLLISCQIIGGRKIFSWMKSSERNARIFFFGIFPFLVFAHFPILYWLFLYKRFFLDISPQNWNAWWIVTFVVGARIFSLGLSELYRIGVKSGKKLLMLNWKKIFSKKKILPEENFKKENFSLEKNISQLANPRREFIRTTAFAGAGIILSGKILSAEDAEQYTIDRIILPIKNLPAEFEGFTIGMISDIHSSPFMLREEMEYYRRGLESLKTDALFLPGDFVNARVKEVYPFADAFQGMKAPYGVYGVTGNHDYFTNEIETVVKEIEQAGIKILRNENLAIEKNGAKLHLLGIDDIFSKEIGNFVGEGKSPSGAVESMMMGLPDKSAKILLCHKPYYFEGYARLGIDVTLSGHTHGGQIVLGDLGQTNLSFAGIVSDYIKGFYKSKSNPDATMYVTRGIGAVGIPIRVNCPPEITHMTLTRKA